VDLDEVGLDEVVLGAGAVCRECDRGKRKFAKEAYV
jgi:hypothetical protein